MVETMVPGTAVSCATSCRVGAIMVASRPADWSKTPSGERVLDRSGNVADMDTAVIKVEVECLWFAFPEG